jgi:PPP family 3-phenylpropionic acid transporter
MHFLTEAVPEDRSATAQGVYSAAVAGLGLGLVTLVCGPLYRSLGGEAYAVMALIALIGVLCTAFLLRRWHGERVVGPIEVQPQSADGGGRTAPET